jgi:general L-amino acid transport system substrate-binding protein
MTRIWLRAARLAVVLFLLTRVYGAETTPPSSILANVKQTGTLQCGVIREEEDYSKAGVHGNRAAFDMDVCKAVALAIFGDKQKILFLTYPDEPKAIEALRSGKVQVIATATPSFTNTTELGVAFSPVILFEGEGFLVNKKFGIKSVNDLADKKVCFIAETSNAENLSLFAAREHVDLIPFPFEEQGEMEAAMYTANCAAMTSDVTQLANTRARYRARAKEFEILPQLISKDPLAVAYPSGDAQWAAVVNSTVSAIIQAEESGISSANVEQMRTETVDPAISFYFAPGSGVAKLLHLDPDWAVRVIKAIGNYGEMYDRDLGTMNPLQLARGPNNLWSKGGLIYAPPIGSK